MLPFSCLKTSLAGNLAICIFLLLYFIAVIFHIECPHSQKMYLLNHGESLSTWWPQLLLKPMAICARPQQFLCRPKGHARAILVLPCPSHSFTCSLKVPRPRQANFPIELNAPSHGGGLFALSRLMAGQGHSPFMISTFWAFRDKNV